MNRALRGRWVAATIILSLAALAPVGAGAGAAVERRPTATTPDAAYRSNELLVRFDPSATESQRAGVRGRNQLTKVRDLPLPGLELVTTSGRTGPPQHAAQVSRERVVRYAEPNYLWKADDLPTDPQFDDLWGLHNTGQTGGTVDADIDAPEAWDIDSDTSGIVVAVIDTGVQPTHPDLAANMWVNADEIPGNGIDDDNNTYVDDIHGWDFFNGDESVFDGEDGDEHGTHVAGTIAATANNGTAVAGVSKAKIMSLKFLGPVDGDTAHAILALDYAMANGARVANNSWGGGAFSQALAEKIQDAADAGILFVAAAGNDGRNTDHFAHYPSSYTLPSIVSVAATDHADLLASFSNYGATSVDLGAPGAAIVSTIPWHTKAIKASHANGGISVYHAFGLEGVLGGGPQSQVLAAALSEAGVTSGNSILVVDDDNGASFQTTYQAAFAALSRTIDQQLSVKANPCTSGPSLSTLNTYDVVVWFTGADFGCTLTSADQTNLTSFLDAGGKLVLFGEDIAFDIPGTTFLQDVLHATYLLDADQNYTLGGASSTDYAGLTVVLADTGAAAQQYSDAIEVRAGGEELMRGLSPTDSYGGTSMATPHVTGAVAHLLAKFPAMRSSDVKSRLMDTGDARASLAGKTISGRRLNLANALATGTISGGVTNTASAPLEGICVSAYSHPSGSYLQTTTTNAAGAYSLMLPTGTYAVQFRPCTPATSAYGAEWHVDKFDWATVTTVPLTVGATQVVDAVLATAATLSGTVTAAVGGSPLGDVCVNAFTLTGTSVGAARTAANGTWTIPGFGAGSYQVRFRDCLRTGSNQYATEWWNGAHDNASKTLVVFTSGDTTPRTLNASLDKAGFISGTVTSAATSVPLGDVCVSAYAAVGGGFVASTRTSTNGTYTLGAMGNANYRLLFSDCGGRGYASEWYDNQPSFAVATSILVTSEATVTGRNAALA